MTPTELIAVHQLILEAQRATHTALRSTADVDDLAALHARLQDALLALMDARSRLPLTSCTETPK